MDYTITTGRMSGRWMCWMWRGRNAVAAAGNAVRAATAWRLLLGVLAALVLAGPAAGQQAQDLAFPVVDDLQGLTSHRLVEQWVRRGAVPGERAGAMRASGVLGVRVTLRSRGLTVGTGTAMRGDLDAALKLADDRLVPLPVDLVTLLEPATSEALREVQANLQDRFLGAQLRAARDPNNPDPGALPDLADVGKTLSVDIQIACRPDRIVLAEDAPAGRVFARFAPGYHGLLARDDRGATFSVWPATALGQNATPNRQVIRLLDGMGLDPTKPERLGRPGGVDLYRFEVIHVVRPSLELPPAVLLRGGKILPGRFVDMPTLNNMAERMALHLSSRYIGNARMRGTYHPATDRYHPELAPDLQATLGMYALVRYAQAQRAAGRHDALLNNIDRNAVELVNAVVGRQLAPDAPMDPVTSAFALLTIIEAPPDAFAPQLRDRVSTMLMDRIDDQGHVRADPDDAASQLPTASAAAVTAALARLYEQTRDPAVADAVARSAAALWQRAESRFDVNTLPWVAFTHQHAAHLLAEQGLIDEATLQDRDKTLADQLDMIAQLQVVERPVLGPDDVNGGIVLNPGPEGSPPNPAWQTAQLLSTLALCARDEAIVPRRKRADALVTASGAARFIAQLMLDEPNTFGLRNPIDALGGIRLSLYDNTLDLPPTALSLLAVMDLRDTINAFSR